MTKIQENCLEDCRKYIRSLLRGDATGHDWLHVDRVEKTAMRIFRSEPGVDEFRLRLTALLHDADDRKLFPETAKTLLHADSFLREHSETVDNDLRERILQDIRDIPYSGGRTPEGIEGRIVQDSDRIDALGAIGIARLFAFGGARGITLYDPNIPPTGKPGCDSTSINHFYEKILKLEDTVNTKAGRVMARQRARFMREYLNRFEEEVSHA